MVAKSFQSFEMIGEPYTLSGRQYIKVKNPKTCTIRQVRWYSDAEYYRMYPEEVVKKATELGANTRPLKDVLGFEKGYITIFKGDTYANLEWFQESIARYHKMWGWYIISTDEVPAALPPKVEAVRLNWDDISLPSGDLKTETAIKSVIESLVYDPGTSEYVGEIGDRLTLTLTVISSRSVDSYYGSSIIHNFTDEVGNVYTWITAAKNWPVGTVKTIKGTVKEHKLFRNTKTTVLTRCTEI